jgi:dihydroflavonol-4-reductase
MAGKILVTGATGLVGNNVTRRLIESGLRPRVLVRGDGIPAALAGLNLELVRGDICDAESLRAAFAGIDCVVHSAGFVHLGRSHLELHRSINVDGTRNVADAAIAARARMIHISSCDAISGGTARHPADEDTPLRPPIACNYVRSKRAAEQVVLERIGRGLDAVIINPGFMLGPWDWKPSSGRMMLEVARNRCLLAPRGHFSVCDARDVADGIITAIDKAPSGRRYIMAGETQRYLDAWRLFASITGGRRPLFRPGPVNLWIGGKLGDLLGRLTGQEPDLNSAAIALARQPKYYSSQRAISELGYRIRPIAESGRDAWDWFVAHGYATPARSERNRPRTVAFRPFSGRFAILPLIRAGANRSHATAERRLSPP